MTSIAEVYGRGFNRDFKYYFTHWLPNGQMSVGVVGALVDKLFRPLDTLPALGVRFDPQQDVIDDPHPSPMKFVSSSGVTTTVKMAGEVNPNLPNIPKGSAGLKIEFAREGAFTLDARESYEPRIRSVAALEQQILDLHRARRWPRHYVVAFSVVTCPYADLLISETGSSSIELEVQAAGNAGSVELGDASVQFTTRRTSGRVLEMRGSRNVAPAVQLLGLRRRWTGGLTPGPLPRGMGDMISATLNDVFVPPRNTEESDEPEYGLVLLSDS